MNWSAIEAIAVSVSVVLAALTFVASSIGKSRARRGAEIQNWQRTVVQGMFHRNAGSELSFEEIRDRYRSEAVAYPDLRLSRQELSDGRLREILVWMVAQRIIEQNPNDHYVLPVSAPQLPQQIFGALMNLLSPIMEQDNRRAAAEKALFDGVSRFMIENNFGYTLSDAALRISSGLGVDAAQVQALLARMVMNRVLVLNSEDRLGFVKPSISAPKLVAK